MAKAKIRSTFSDINSAKNDGVVLTAIKSGTYTRRMSQIRRSAGMAMVFLVIGAALRAEPLPGRESDLVLPSLSNGVGSLVTSPADATKTLLTNGQAVRIGTNGSIQWTYSPGQFLGGLNQIASFPDGTVFATSVQGYFFPFPPGTLRASVVRLDASGPASPPPSASLTDDGEPLPFPNPIIGVTPGGVAADPLNDRVYTLHQRLVINPLLGTAAADATVNVYDRSPSLLAQRAHVFEFPNSFIQLAGVFADSSNFVWVAGVEYPPSPLPRRLFVERHPPNLSGPPIVHRLTLDATFGGTIRAALDPRGGLVIGGERFGGNSDYFRRVSSEGFSASFREPGFAGGPMAVDAEGGLYIAGHEPIGGLPAIVKISSTDTQAWGASFVTLSSDRRIEALWSPSAGIVDVAGTIDVPFPGSDQSFVSRYKPGAGGAGAIVAISPTEQSASVSTQLSQPLTIETRNTSNLPQADIPVDFSLGPVPDGATGFQFVAKENRSNALGRATAGFIVGDLPLEYDIKVDCPSCTPPTNSVGFRVCGELPGELYRQNVNKSGKENYIADRLADSDDPSDSIEHHGCTLTAFTMLLNIFRARYNLTYPDSTPGTLNKALTPAGFSPVARLNLPTATSLFAGNQVRYVDAYNVSLLTSVRDVMDEVDTSLKRGDPALIRLQSSTGALGHFVTVVGRCGNRYRVLDPYTGTDYSIIDLDNLGAKVILGVRIFQRGTQ